MSLGRLMQEFQPLFQALDHPQSTQIQHTPRTNVARTGRGIFDDPFYNQMISVRPAVDVHEDNLTYRVEAELPGVPRENVDVSISEGGHSLTIQGSLSRKIELHAEPESEGQVAKDEKGKKPGRPSTQIAAERTFVGNTAFSRTVWLPTPVDSQNVSAKLSDGILTVILNKVDDKAVKVLVS